MVWRAMPRSPTGSEFPPNWVVVASGRAGMVIVGRAVPLTKSVSWAPSWRRAR